MELETSTIDAIKVLSLSGRFDAQEAPKVAQWEDEQITSDTSRVIVNLSGANFLDSTALATLVKGLKRCRTYGGDLFLCGLDQRVRTIIELTRLDRAFRIFDDIDAALLAFSTLD